MALAGCVEGSFVVEARAVGMETSDGLLAVEGTGGLGLRQTGVAYATASAGVVEHDGHSARVALPGGEVTDVRSHAVADASANDHANGSAVARVVVGEVSLLGGMVVAEGIVAQASAGGPAGPNTAGSGIARLSIGGVNVRPLPLRQTYTILGHEVRTYEVTPTEDGVGVTITMLRITTADGKEIKVGVAYAWANYVPGGATCADARAEAGALSGASADAETGVLRTVAAGTGAWGNSEGHTISGIVAAPIVRAELEGARAWVSGYTSAKGSADVAFRDLAVLSGIVRAQVVHLHAGADTAGSPRGWADTTFTELLVAGQPVPDPVPPNTVLGPFALPGGGQVTVVLNERSIATDDASQTAAVDATGVHVFGQSAAGPVDLRLATANVRADAAC